MIFSTININLVFVPKNQVVKLWKCKMSITLAMLATKFLTRQGKVFSLHMAAGVSFAAFTPTMIRCGMSLP